MAKTRPKKTRGRPTKANRERCAAIVQHVADGVAFSRACRLEGISDMTGWNWRQKGHADLRAGRRTVLADFVSELDVAIAERTGVLERDMWEEAKDNWQVRGWLLQRLHPDEYGSDVEGKAKRQAIEELLDLVCEYADSATYNGIVRALERAEGATHQKPVGALTTKERLEAHEHWRQQREEADAKLRELDEWYAEQSGRALRLASGSEEKK